MNGITMTLDNCRINQQVLDNSASSPTTCKCDSLPSSNQRGLQGEFPCPLRVITARPSLVVWYLKSIANPPRPFQISIVPRFGICIATAAALRSILFISLGLLSGASNCEVRSGHLQEGRQASKKCSASTMNDAERCSSFRLILAIATPIPEVGIPNLFMPGP